MLIVGVRLRTHLPSLEINVHIYGFTLPLATEVLISSWSPMVERKKKCYKRNSCVHENV